MESESTNRVVQDNHSPPGPVAAIQTTTVQTAQSPISITGWYQYQDSVGLSSATYLPQGLNTIVSGNTIASWISCACARYSWGNDAHTLVKDVYGYPLIYLIAPTSQPTPSPSSVSPSNVPTLAPSLSVSITGWYQYQDSVGLSSATYLPQGLNTLVSGNTIASWISCACARYSWGNAAHTLVKDVYGNPLIYLIAPTSQPTPSPTSSNVPTLTPSSLVPITGWYQYQDSVGLSSATYLPQGLNTLVSGNTIASWISCACARYSWGNDAHTLVKDAYGFPIIYLLANVPSTVSPSLTPTSVPSIPKPSIIPSAAPSTSTPSMVPSSVPPTTVSPSTLQPSIAPSCSFHDLTIVLTAFHASFCFPFFGFPVYLSTVVESFQRDFDYPFAIRICLSSATLSLLGLIAHTMDIIYDFIYIIKFSPSHS